MNQFLLLEQGAKSDLKFLFVLDLPRDKLLMYLLQGMNLFVEGSVLFTQVSIE